MSTAVTVKVTGRVQGVAFRWYAVQEVGRRGEMRLVAAPSPDIADLIDPPG